MEIIGILFAIQLVAIFAVGAFAWRRFDDLKREVALLRDDLEVLSATRMSVGARARKAQQQELFATVAAATRASDLSAAPPTDARPSNDFSEVWARTGAKREKFATRLVPIEDAEAQQSWRGPGDARVSLDTWRGLAIALALANPAIGFAFGWPAITLTLSGVGFAVVALLASLRLGWKASAWAAALGAGGWALVGLETGAAAQYPLFFSLAMAVAGIAGLTQAALRRRVWSGATMTLLTAAATLALVAGTSFIAPQGIAYGLLVAGAAALGASRLRRDGLHSAAFVAAGAGLLVHSGQHDAAIWFTPLAAWAGAIFFGIAAVRVPALGERGALIATTGAAAPLFAAGSLALSQQGLAAPWAAAGAFVALAALFAGVLALAARRVGAIGALKLTSWVLVSAISIALAAAMLITLPSPIAAAALGILAMGLIGADKTWPDIVWRTHAAMAAAASFAVALTATQLIGASEDLGGPYGQALLAFAAPAALVGVAALAAQGRANTSAALEAVAIGLALLFTTELTRIVFSAGAPLLQPISFVEAGVHVATWMGAALLLVWRADDGAGDVRRAYALMLAGGAVGACVIGALLWLTPYWSDRPEIAQNWPLLAHAPLGFMLPAALAWGHWVYWRAERAPMRARIALSAAGALTAAFTIFEVVLPRSTGSPNGLEWVIIALGALAFALAVTLQFAPAAMLRPADRSSDLEEYFERHG